MHTFAFSLHKCRADQHAHPQHSVFVSLSISSVHAPCSKARANRHFCSSTTKRQAMEVRLNVRQRSSKGFLRNHWPPAHTQNLLCRCVAVKKERGHRFSTKLRKDLLFHSGWKSLGDATFKASLSLHPYFLVIVFTLHNNCVGKSNTLMRESSALAFQMVF